MNGTSLLNNLLDYISHIDWRAVFEWYMTNLDAGYLVWAWEQGRPFTQEDWMSIALLWGHVMLLVSLFYLLFRRYQESLFREWVAHRRSQLITRQPKESSTKLEPKFTGLLKKAYSLHRLAMYEQARKQYMQAFHDAPYDLNTYLVGIKMAAEMEVPDRSFVQFLTDSIEHLREKHPRLWNDVARYGRETAPKLTQWELHA